MDIFNIFKKKEKAVRYCITVQLFKGKEITKMVFSPLAKNRARALEYIMIVSERRGYEGMKVIK